MYLIKKLSELFIIERGGSPRPIEKYITNESNGINWIKISDATKSGKYIYKTEQKIISDGIKRSRMVYENDFILSNSMSFGRPYIMKTTGCIHDGWLVLRNKVKDEVNQDYLYYILGSDYVFNQFDRLAAGSTVRNLNIGLVESVNIPLPPLSTQLDIVARLDSAMAEIEALRAETESGLANTRELWESTLESVFASGGKDWEEKTMEDVCEISSKLIDPKEAKYQSFPHVGGANIESITGNLIDLKTAKEEKLISGKFLFDESIVLYSKIRPYLIKVTRPDFIGLCSADIYPLSPKKNILNKDFLYYILISKDFTEYAIKGSARAGMPKVNREHLFAYSFLLPPFSEQSRIVAHLDAVRAETEQLERLYMEKLASLDELRRSVLAEAFL